MTHIVHNQCLSTATNWLNITNLASTSIQPSLLKSLASFFNQKEALSVFAESAELSSICPFLDQENQYFSPEQIDSSNGQLSGSLDLFRELQMLCGNFFKKRSLNNRASLPSKEEMSLIEIQRIEKIAQSLSISQTIEIPVLRKGETTKTGHIERIKEKSFEESCEQSALNQSGLPLEILKALTAFPIEIGDDEATDRLAQQILGSYFGKNSGLEGIDPALILNYALQVVEKKVDVLEKNVFFPTPIDPRSIDCQDSLYCAVFKTMAAQFKKALDITKAFQQDSLDAFMKAIRPEMLALQEGQSFFFIGGWPKHAIAYEFIKEEGNTFTLRIYNRGDGTKYHPSFVIGSQTAILPFTELVYVPAQNLLRIAFLKAIHELKHAETQSMQKAEQLYQVLLPQLEGKLSTNHYTPDQLMEEMKAGHCSYFSLTGVASQMLHSQDLYSRWEFELHFHTLLNYFRALKEKNRLAVDERARRLLHKSSEQFARTARDAFQRGAISLDELTFVNRETSHVQEAIAKAEKTFLETTPLIAKPPFSIQPAGATWEFGVVVLPEIKKTNLEIKEIKEISTPQFELNAFHKNLMQFRNSYKAYFTGSPSIEQCHSIKMAIQKLALSLPISQIQRIGDQMLSETPSQPKAAAEKGDELIAELGEIGKDFLFCAMRSNQFSQEIGVHPSDYFTLVKLLTIADSLSLVFSNQEKFPDTRTVDLDGLCQTAMSEFLEGGLGGAYFHDPHWQYEFSELRNYWQGRKNGKPLQNLSFFGFEEFPSSTYPDEMYFYENDPKILNHPNFRWYFGDPWEKQGWTIWSMKKEWPDLKWAEKRIQNNRFQEKIQQFVNTQKTAANLEIKAPYDLAISILFDNLNHDETFDYAALAQLRHEIFSKTYFALRDLSSAVDFILHNDWDISSVTLDRQRGIQWEAQIEPTKSSRHILWAISPPRPFLMKTDFGTKGNVVTRKKDKTAAKQQNKNTAPPPPRFLQPGTEKNAPDLFHSHLLFAEGFDDFGTTFGDLVYRNETKGLKPRERRRLDPHSLLFLDKETINPVVTESDYKTSSLFTLQKMRVILQLSSLPERQIVETLGYFTHHIEDLQDAQFQMLFKKLMFEPPLLLEKLQSPYGKELAQKLASFCNEGYAFSLKSNDIFLASFFLEAEDFFSAAVKIAHGQTAGFLHAREEFSKLFGKSDLSESEKTRIATGIIHAYNTQIPPKGLEVADFIAASIWMQRSPFGPEDFIQYPYFSKSAKEAAKDAFFRFKKEIKGELANNRDGILNRAASLVTGNPLLKSWKEEKGIWSATDESCQIDMFRMKFFQSGLGMASTPLPYEIRKQIPEIASFLKGGIQEIAPGEYLGKGENGAVYKLVESSDGSQAAAYREIDGRFLRLVNRPNELPESLDFCHFWLYHMKDKGGFFPSAKPPQFFLTHRKTGEFVAEVELENVVMRPYEGGHRIVLTQKAIHRLSADGKRQNSLLGDAAALKALHGIESPNYIRAWVAPSTYNVQSIELPRLGLTFTVKDNQAFSGEHPGYKIAEKQIVESLGDFTHYLVLEKGKSEDKLVLLPIQGFQPIPQNSLAAPAIPNRSLEDKERLMGALDGPRFPLLAFDLKTSGQLKARSEEGRLYLAILRLWKQDQKGEAALSYKEAKEGLCWYGSQTRPYTPEEERILHWVVNLEQANNDSDPRAVGVRLKAGYWLIKNRFDFGNGLEDTDKDRSLVDAIARTYSEYLQAQHRMPLDFKLSAEEEKFLSIHLSDSKEFEGNAKSKAKELDGNALEEPESIGLKIIERFQSLLPKESATITQYEAQHEFIRRFLFSLFREDSTPIRGSLFDPEGLFAKLTDLYPLAKSGTFESYIELYNQLTQRTLSKTIRLSDLHREILGSDINGFVVSEEKAKIAIIEQEILFALKLIMLGTGTKNDLAAASLLAAAIEIPEEVPSSEEFLRLVQHLRNAKTTLERSEASDHLEDRCRTAIKVIWHFLPDVKEIPWSFDEERLDRFSTPEFTAPKIPEIPLIEQCLPSDSSFDEETQVHQIGKKLVRDYPPTNIERTEKKEAAAIVKQIFKVETDNHLVRNDMKSLRNKLIVFAESKEAASPIYLQPKYTELLKIKNEVISKIEETNANLNKQEKYLSDLANQMPALLDEGIHPAHRELRASKLASGDESLITLDELIYLFAAHDADRLRLRNPLLSNQKIQEIFTQTRKFLVQATSKQYLERVLDQINRAEKPLKKYERINHDTANRQQLRHFLTVSDSMMHSYEAKSYNEIRSELTDKEIFAYYKACGVKEVPTLPVNPSWLTWLIQPTLPLNRTEALQTLDANIEAGRIQYPDIQRSLEEIAKIGHSVREYSIDRHPEYLVFEYYMSILLRKAQVENIEKFAANGSAMESIMGSGKTTVLLVLTALRNADGKKLALLVMPEHMLGSMASVLQERLKLGLNQLIDVFEFKRGHYGLEHLNRIETRLNSAIQEKKAVLMSGSSLQTLFLQYIELLSAKAPKHPALHKKELAAYKRIFSLLKNSADMTLDEMDLLLDVLKTHHFTIGDGQEIHRDILKTTVDLYERLMNDPDLEMKWNFGSSPSGKASIFTDETYKDLKEKIIGKVIKGQIFQTTLGSFVSKLSANEKLQIRNYLKALPETYPVLDKAPLSIKNTLAVLKEQLHTFFPLTAKKQVDEHYGPLPENADLPEHAQFMAIPYHGSNNPIVGSEFGTELEVINYTIQLYLAKGIGKNLIKNKIDSLQEWALSEKKKGVADEKNPALIEFKRMGGQASMSLAHLKETDLASIHSYINQNRGLQFELIRDAILPKLRIYNRQLKTSAHIFPLLAKIVRGCSGTLWNFRSYPLVFRNNWIESNTEEKTLLTLWEENLDPEKKILKLPSIPNTMKQPEKIRQLLQSMYEKTNGSLIDLGGVFRGISNLEVARMFRKIVQEQNKNPEIKGIVYLNENDRIMVLPFFQEKPVLLSESGLKRTEILVYWAQQNTTGIDITVDPKMKATITIGSHTMMRDILQAAWRLRGLGKGQYLNFAVSQQDEEIISHTLQNKLGIANTNPLTLKELFLYAKYLESIRKGDDNFRSLRQKIDALLIEPVWDALLTKDDEETVLQPILQTLFETRKELDPFDLYGGIDQEVKIVEAIADEVDRAKKIVQTQHLPAMKELKIPFDSSKIFASIDKIAAEEISFLPFSVVKKNRNAPATDVEVELETQVEKEEIHDRALPDATPNAWPIVIWPKNNAFTKNFFLPIPRKSWAKWRPTHSVDSESNALISLKSVTKKLMSSLTGSAPVISVQEALRSHCNEAALFDPALLASMNLMPTYPAPDRQPTFDPFGPYQDTCRNALIAFDTTGQLTYVMLDAWDALQWERFLEEDLQIGKSVASGQKIALYNWDAGLYATGKNSFDPNQLKNDPKFLEFHVQAKFLSGETAYSKEELPILKRWIQNSGPQRMAQFFEKMVAQWKTVSKLDLPKSDLGQVFKEFHVVI